VAHSFPNHAHVAKRRHTPNAGPLAHKLAQAMKSSKDMRTQSAVAKKAGVSQSTVGRVFRGEVASSFKTVRRIAEVLGVPIDEPAEKEPASGTVGAAPTPVENSQKVPLIAWIEAGAFAESVDLYQPGDAERWINCPKKCGSRSFALQVEGESMKPLYESGDIIYVDPDVPSANGKDVVVRLDDSDKVTFKRLVIEGADTYLKPLNEAWPDQYIRLPADARIVGVVIGKWVDR
jgi:SOS-response transcriptional repressor LexA